MKKFLKITVWVIVIFLAAALLIPTLFRDKIAGIVKDEANKMLTATLDFESLDLSLLRHFPHASIEMEGLTLVGCDRFEGDTIVAAQRISVVVDLLSIFGDNGFEVSKVIVAQPALHAHKLEDGAVNWDIMKPSEEPEEGTTDEEPSSFRLSLCDLRITDAAIRYEDDSTHMSFATDPLSLRLQGDLSAEKTGLNLDVTAEAMRFVSGGIPLLSNAEAELHADIDADLANNHYTFSQNRFRLNAIEMGLDGWVELADDAIRMDVTAGCERVLFKDVLSMIPAFYTRDFRNLTAGGELSMALWARGALTDKELPAFELKTNVKDGHFQYASLPKAVNNIQINFKASNPGDTMDATEIDLSRFSMNMAGNAMSATLHASNLATDPRFQASANGKVNLGAIREVYPLDENIHLNGIITADLKASGCMSDIDAQRYEKLGAAGTFVIEQLALNLENLPDVRISRAAATITPAAMTLGEFGVTVGRSDLEATGQLTGYLGYLLRDSKLAGRLYVKSNLLDLNEIMGIIPESTESAESAEAPVEETAPLQSVAVPTNLDLALTTELKKIQFQKMNISNLSGKMSVANGVLGLDKLQMKLFEGQVNVSGHYATKENPERPQLDLKASFNNASFVRTFEELDIVRRIVPIFAKTGGNYAMSLDLKTALDATLSPDYRTLNATGDIRSANIHIQNIEAFEQLATALNYEPLRKLEAKDVTIRFTIKEGRLLTQPFDLKLGKTKMTLSGSTGLDQTIDYTGKVAIPSEKTNGVLQNVNIKIGGTFSKPKVSVNVKEAAKEAVTNVVNQQIQKLTGSENLSAEIEKRAQQLRDEAAKAGAKLVEAAQAQRDKLVSAAEPKGTLAKIAAEKAGDKLVKEAEKQSEKLVAEAEAKIAKLKEGKGESAE